jgi:hypothetical protein
MNRENYDALEKSVGVTTELMKSLRSSAALENGTLWMEQRSTILGFDVGLTRREKFRELHKNDGTGTTTEPKPKAE